MRVRRTNNLILLFAIIANGRTRRVFFRVGPPQVRHVYRPAGEGGGFGTRHAPRRSGRGRESAEPFNWSKSPDQGGFRDEPPSHGNGINFGLRFFTRSARRPPLSRYGPRRPYRERRARSGERSVLNPTTAFWRESVVTAITMSKWHNAPRTVDSFSPRNGVGETTPAVI